MGTTTSTGLAVAGALILTAATALACSDATGTAPDDAAPSGELVVFAAASLTDVLEPLTAAFVAEHPGVEVVANLAGSQTLASQLTEGARADVLITADLTQLAVVADAGLVDGDPATLATNGLAIAVEPGNPRAIAGLADLADAQLIVVLPAEEVPAGRYAREALTAAGVEVAPASLERDVRAARAKVELGEADAAVVYRSDVVAAAGRVDGVAIAPEHDVVARYPIARLTDAPNPGAAAAFVAFTLGDTGQAVLADAGFGAP